MIPVILCLSALTQAINECSGTPHPRNKDYYWTVSCSSSNDIITLVKEKDLIEAYRDLLHIYPNRSILCDITDGDKEELLFIDRAPR